MNKIAVLLLAVLLVGGLAYYGYSRLVKPEVITGAWQMKEANVYSPDGKTVRGYWAFTLTVDSRDEICFTIADEKKSLRQDLAKGIPPGSEIRMGKEVSVIFNPKGPPYISGPVERMGYVYDEEGRMTTKRVWQFYAIGYPEWHIDGRHAPYEITVEREGETLFGPKTFVSGIREGWDTGRKIDLGMGMEVKQFAQLTNGLNIPTRAYALCWIASDGGSWTELKELNSLKMRLRSGYHNTWVHPWWGDPVDEWPEVSHGAEIDRGREWVPTPDGLEDFPMICEKITKERVFGVPKGIKRFTDVNYDPFYRPEVPKVSEVYFPNERMKEDTFVSADTDLTAIRALPEASVMAYLYFKVPSDVFKSWVYRPPYGMPEEVGKYAPKSREGGRTIVSCDVKNVGPTGDTFVAELDYPGVSVVRGPGGVYIPAGETRTFSWCISKPATTKENYTVDWTAEVTAINSERSILIHGTQDWIGGLEPTPPPGYGTVSGKVVDSAGKPIHGACVSCGGQMAFTNTRGIFTVGGVPSGTRELSITAEGYETMTRDVFVSKNKLTSVGTITLYEAKARAAVPWKILATIAIVISVGAVLYCAYRMKRGP